MWGGKKGTNKTTHLPKTETKLNYLPTYKITGTKFEGKK